MNSDLRVIRVAHASRGRLRVRLPWLRNDRAAAVALADQLVALDGVVDVAVRPRTGSLLLRYDEARTGSAALLAALRRRTAVTAVLRPGEPAPAPAPRAARGGSTVARELAAAVRGLDEDISAATSGRLDLGTTAGLGLLLAGATEVAVTRTLPVPPWFSLAWWAFRTFTMFEHGDQAGAAAEVPAHGRRADRAGHAGTDQRTRFRPARRSS